MFVVYFLFSAGTHTEYTEVPLGALDIAAADSLTLSPHNGKVCCGFTALYSHLNVFNIVRTMLKVVFTF